MKKTLTNLLGKLMSSSAGNAAGAEAQHAPLFEVVSGEELLAIRGGDKEYKPIYEDEAAAEGWQKPSVLLDV